ncbi:MAG TPA: CBS domain-containing protein [Acidimicrobiales bacterium]|jgi:CBS domain-containing protein
MKISDLLADKGDAVEVIDAAATIAEAVRRLTLHSIGALVVSNDARSVDGILSERDVVRLLARHGDAALHRVVADAMTTPVSTCRPSDEVVSLMSLMTERRIRHVPVVAAGRLVGIVSIGDVVKSRVDQLERDRKELLEYVSGR